MAATMGVLRERERELETLEGALDRACVGEGTVVVIEGAAGVGKTELALQTRATAERAGMLQLSAKCSELERPFAFAVVHQLLEGVMNGRTAEPDLLAGAAAPAARLFEDKEPGSRNAELGFEALHSLYWLVANLADRTPVLVAVDDCHWADRDSLRFLAYLAQRIEGLRVALLLAGRRPSSAEEDAKKLWGQVLSLPSVIALYPRPLTESAARDLVLEQLGTEAAEEFCRSCHTATGGNPLFLRELLRALQGAGVVPSAEAAGEVQAVGPGAVSRFVLHRLAVLGGPATRLANAVAVLGDESDLNLAARVAGLGEETARAAADDLVRADIFSRGERLGFVHPIVRAALYEDLAPGERQTAHAAAAEALAESGAAPERIAAHLLLTVPTGDPQSVATLRSAASAVAGRGAPGAAALQLRRALAESPGAKERAEILSELGRYEVAAMDFEAAEEHLQAALRPDAEPGTRAEAASMLGRCAIVSGGHSAEAAVAALASLSEELEGDDDERSLELSSERLIVTASVPRLRAALPGQLERFREQARGHPPFEAVARIHSAHAHLHQGGAAQAAVAETQAALATGLPAAAATGTVFVALLTLRYAEQFDQAQRLLEVALEHARSEGHTARQGLIHGQLAAIALARGSLPDAQVEAETGLLLVDERHFAMPQLLAAAIGAQIERDELAAAAELAQIGDALGSPEDRAYGADYMIARGRLRLAQGQVREGVADLLWCGERLEDLNIIWPGDWRVYAAPALASLGEHQTATELAERQLALAREVGTPGALGMSLRSAALALGGDARLPLLEEAVSVLQASGARLGLAHALADLGAELSRSRRRREGRDLERRAMKLAEECGATHLARKALGELQAGPGRRARVELTGPSSLTAAELRVCREAAAGRTNREVAQAMFVTEKTVERHLSSAYHKLGIRSRFQLGAAIGQ